MNQNVAANANMSSFDQFSENEVLQYLQRNPDFLQRNPQLLQVLDVPAQHDGNRVVDFQQFMVQKLQQDRQRADVRQQALLDSARNNMTVQARMQAGVLRLLEARSLEDLIEMITSELTLMLSVDVISVVMEAATDDEVLGLQAGVRIVAPGMIDRMLGDRETLLQAQCKGDPALYGPAAKLVQSQALLRLHISRETPEGLLAFGSRDAGAYVEGQGTELVAFLTDVIERLVRRFLAH
ncbi:MAG TPA: DUF484 family protein [Alphaproteobacteria bacterium]